MPALTLQEKLGIVSAFERGYSAVEALIAGAPAEELRFAPPIEDAWSINDMLVHFLDADLSLAFRARAAIAESGMEAPVWDELRWKDRLHYDDEDGLACLALAKGLRAFLAVGMRSVAGEDWSSLAIAHPARGRLDLAAICAMYDEHIVFHLPLIRRDRQAWRDRRP